MHPLNAENIFHELADALTRSGQADFLVELTARLSAMFGVDHALIARIDQDIHQAETLAVWSQGKTVANFRYPLTGTPCETVPESATCEYTNAVAELFPHDELLTQLGVKSYLGVSVLTPRGRKLGVLALMHNAEIEITELWREALRISAAQIGAELDRQEQARVARELTHSDGITGLPNRLQLQQHVSQQIQKQQPFVLAIFDVTRFKEVNDLHGYATGDQVLRELAERMLANLTPDEFLARHSGDEFAWVLPSGQQDALASRIAHLRHLVQEPIVLDDRELRLDVSVGVAGYPDHGQTAGELARHASIALAKAKQRHDKYQVFSPDLNTALQQSDVLLSRFRHALENDHLTLHYQPQFSLPARRLVGAEALCRWHDAELGDVSPATFIPMVEERGMAADLGTWVMRAACEQLRSWRQAGTPLQGRLSVNLSATELDDPKLVKRLLRDIQEFSPHQFCLELTESAVMRNPQANVRTLTRLSELGFRIAIDDFGTGYSSLAYLTRFQAKVLKVDKSFTLKMPDSHHNKAIVETILAMCRTLGLTSIAEGVETAAHASLLEQMGCEQVQGFYFGRPVSATEFSSQWLSSTGKD